MKLFNCKKEDFFAVLGMLALELVLIKMTQVNWIVPAITMTVFSILLMWFRSRFATLFSKRDRKENVDQEEKILREVFIKVMDLMENEEFYLNKNIKVATLAEELGFSEKLVSRAINKHGTGNFNNLINTFRIGHAKAMFNSGKYDHYTIEAIAEESGFSNKVSFYNAFKSDTGMSPKQFKALKQS